MGRGQEVEEYPRRLEKERVAVQREHEVMKVEEKVLAEMERRVTKIREAVVELKLRREGKRGRRWRGLKDWQLCVGIWIWQRRV